ncbi:MAG TPA: DUF6497 family protein, partial [Marivita sp.]|nr:DUF6497 family protein [Marivita sp.]
FSPVVRVDRMKDGMRVTAGGRLPTSSQSASVVQRLEEVLHNPKTRARWTAWATAGKPMSYICALCLALPVFASEPLEVPSGQPVTFHEMLWDRPGAGLVYRFRFIAPEIGEEGREYQDVEADMHYLCEDFAVDRIATTGPQPSQIVISFSQSETEFGIANPDVTQFFEAYHIEDETCILEFF